MGGAGSAIGGGNFWQGAVTGLIVSGFNHVANRSSNSVEKANDKSRISKSNPDDIAAGDVINMHDYETNPALYWWAEQSKPGLGEVEIHAHGWRRGHGGMTSVREINDLLYSKSPTWKAMIDGGMKAKIKLTLYACNTGRGLGSMAWQMHQKYTNVTVVAPTNNWAVVFSTNYFLPNSPPKLHYGYIENGGLWKTY